MFHLGFEIAIGMGRGKVIEVTENNAAEILKTRAFEQVSWKIRHEIRDHVGHLTQVYGNKIDLKDRTETVYSVARTDDSSQVLLVSFDSLQRQIKFEKNNDPTVQYLIRVVGVTDDKLVMTHRKYGQELGELTSTELVDVVRRCIEVAMNLTAR